MDNIRAIRNDDDLAWAIAEITPYFENEPEIGTPEADRFDVLGALIEAYEDRYYPIDPPSDPYRLRPHVYERNRAGAR